MNYRFTTPFGLTIERQEIAMDIDAGVGFLVEQLDQKRGVYLSSGVEDPDRYSRFDMGFVDPPLEIIGRQRQFTLRALNPIGCLLLSALHHHFQDLSAEDPDWQIADQNEKEMLLTISTGGGFFAEEERSRQPSLFSPIRALQQAFSGIEDGFLGLYGAFGYDLIFQFEAMDLRLNRPANNKELHLYIPDCVYVHDRRLEQCKRFEYRYMFQGQNSAAMDKAPFEPMPPVAIAAAEPAKQVTSDHSAEEYEALVSAARERIRVGDIFEVVLSRQFSTSYNGKASELYSLMRAINPSPYEFLIQLGDEQLVGASPEMFVRVDKDRVETSPISGTIRRGANAMEDADRIRELYASDKDEVELTMCTDVDRNDKARICRPGTVKLLGRRLIERYAGLFHTVDHVEGRLRDGFDGLDAFLSHMWAVTLTGAPKPMAVRIIEDVEKSARAWYGGAVGVLLMNGNVNTGITIRTAHMHDGQADYRAGATLVWDSDPAAEEQETQTKATAFFRALKARYQGDGQAGEPSAKPAERKPGRGRRIVMIDNQDSFVHTLADYFRQTGADVATYRAGTEITRLLANKPDLVVHSPGPGMPADFQVPERVRELMQYGVAQFGVCLGLQGICEAFGGGLALMEEPFHGKRWQVVHGEAGLFDHVASPCTVAGYHSIHAPEDNLPEDLQVLARTTTGIVMAVRHRQLPIAAVQFHPESILSMGQECGHRIIENVLIEL